MIDALRQYCATDKEIHDLLISGKQKLTETKLLELARDRGIFYSFKSPREELVLFIATLPHDYHDIIGIIDQREYNKRGEKTTSVELITKIDIEDINEIVEKYKSDVVGTEKITHHKKGQDGFVMNIGYDEYDYSKTTLIQRQRRDAEIEFIVKEGGVIIRMPATEKAKHVVDDLRKRVEQKTLREVPFQKIELSQLTNSAKRTSFFTSLISKIQGFTLETVINLKVASGFSSEEDEDFDLDDEDETTVARDEMLAIVHSVALNGMNLVASKQYQELQEGGFYITSITWRSKQNISPYSMIQFDASFDNPKEGTGFKYSVRMAELQKRGAGYSKLFKSVEDERFKAELFKLIESTSRSILDELINDEDSEDE